MNACLNSCHNFSSTVGIFQQKTTSSASDGEYSLHDKDPVNYPEYVVEKMGSGRHSFEDPKCEDVRPLQSQPLDNHHDSKVTKSVVIVEDLTNSTPPGIPASKAVYHVSHIEDETSDECPSPTETDISAAPESEGEVNIFPMKFELSVVYIVM